VPGVGAGFRLEGRRRRAHARTEAGEHVLEHVVRCDAQITFADLDRDVAVPQMISGARERVRRSAFDVQQRLGAGDHLHYPAITRREQVPAAQNAAARHHEAHFFAIVQPRAQAAFLPQLERELELGSSFHAALLHPFRDFDHQNRK
jgi:hypothetical protein